MHRSLWVALSSGIVAACAHGAVIAAPAAPIERERSDDEDRVTEALAALSRPSVPFVASAWTAAAPPEPFLVVRTNAIAVGEGPPIVTLQQRRVPAADRVGARGWLVRPLHEALAGAAGGPHGVAIDPEIPYRTVYQVLYTLEQTGQRERALLVEAEGSLRALPVRLPTLARRGPGEEDAFEEVLRLGATDESPEDVLAQADGVLGVDPSQPAEPERERSLRPSSLTLSVLVTARGFMLYGSGGILAPGCEEVATGPVTTIPTLESGEHAFTELTRCLERVHALFPDESRLIVSADPEVPFRAVAGAIAAARGTAERPVFPHALLSPSMR